MTHDEAIHFAEYLKHNYTINFADMEDFCDTVIESLKKESSEDAVSRSDVMALIERTNLKYSSSFTRGIRQKAFEDLLYETLSLPPITPKGITVTDFADKCRECGAKYGKLLKQYQAFAEWVVSEIFDENWEDNKDSFVEIACRKLEKLGIVRVKGDEWELVESQESEVQNGRCN